MNTLLEKLMRRPSFQNLVMDAESKDMADQATQRRAWAAALRELRASRDKRLAPLVAKHEKLEASRQPVEKAVQEARRLSREAFNDITALSNALDHEEQRLVAQLRDSASDAFREYGYELTKHLEHFQRDEGSSYGFGFQSHALTKDGYTAVFKLLIDARTHAWEVMPLDAEIVDPIAAIAAHRQQVAAEVSEIAVRYDRHKAWQQQEDALKQRLQRQMLEQDLAFRRRLGCPDHVLAEYRREEEERLGLSHTVGA